MTGTPGSSRSLRIPPVDGHPSIKSDSEPLASTIVDVPPRLNSLRAYGSLVNGEKQLRRLIPGLLAEHEHHGNLMAVRSLLAEMQAAVKRLIEIEEGE